MMAAQSHPRQSNLVVYLPSHRHRHPVVLQWYLVRTYPYCDENMTFDRTGFRWSSTLVGRESRGIAIVYLYTIICIT
jgi:hypothetical protein